MRALHTTMMMMRYVSISSSKVSYSQALLIALRYSVVRRQFKNISGQKEETKLLDYQTQQMKLFPILANMYTHCYTAEVIYDIYVEFCQDVEK